MDSGTQPRVPDSGHYDVASDEGGENWASMASLIETCKLNEVNPMTYMTELLTRLVNGWPQDRINELMPWCWTPKPDA